MMIARVLSIASISLTTFGCSIQPLPQDVTGYDTYQIVSKIRCEMRDAIRAYAIQYIRRFDPQLAERLANGGIEFAALKLSELPTKARDVFERYDQSAIAYDFTFDITEINKANADLDFVRLLTRGPLNIGLKAGKELERQNTRNFRIADSFEDLVIKLDDKYCIDSSNEKNWVYPITGKIGLGDLVGAFLDLNQSGNLSPKEGGKVPVIADTIEFTTKLSGTANPRIELRPVGRGFQLAKLGLTADVSRSDVHKVIIAMSLPPEPPLRAPKVPTKTGAQAAAKKRALQELDRQEDRAFRVEFQKFDQRLDALSE